MYLHRPHTLTPEVRREEGLSRCVAIDKDGVIADRAEIGQRMGKGFPRNKKVVLEV
jgi:hypothetical protein